MNTCSWCGHAWPHPHPCPREIDTGKGGRKPCPCVRAEVAS